MVIWILRESTLVSRILHCVVGQRQQIMRVNVRLIESVIIIDFAAVSLVFLAAKLQRTRREYFSDAYIVPADFGPPGTFMSPSRPKSSGSSGLHWR